MGYLLFNILKANNSKIKQYKIFFPYSLVPLIFQLYKNHIDKRELHISLQLSFKDITWLITTIPWHVLYHKFYCNYYFHITLLFLILGCDLPFFQLLLAKIVNTHQNGCQLIFTSSFCISLQTENQRNNVNTIVTLV